MNASIITIGDELLIGQVIDTNSAWIARELNRAGITLLRRVAVGDNKQDIRKALDEESDMAGIIIITGGLGPTSDDITKPLLCEYFNGRLVMHEDTLKQVSHLFEKVFKRPLTEVNRNQAMVPDVCTVIPNMRGTAPGMWFEKEVNGETKIFVSLPGVPNEMQGMIPAVIEKIKERFALPLILHRTALTAGIGESALAEMIKDFEAGLPPAIRLAYLPNYGMVRLRLSTSGFDREAVEKNIDSYFADLLSRVKEYLVTDKDEPLEKVTGHLLREGQATAGTAESCTGGYIAHLLTAHAGASDYFAGSVVSYSNEVKEKVLKVSPATLRQQGAVSKETVLEMLGGALQLLGCDYAIAVSGIMGPGGGTDEKPVGTVWIAAGNQQENLTLQLNLRFDRKRNIEITAQNALNLLRKFILAQTAG